MVSKYTEPKLSWHDIAMGWNLPNCDLIGKGEDSALGCTQWEICSLRVLGIKFNRHSIGVINIASEKANMFGGWINNSRNI